MAVRLTRIRSSWCQCFKRGCLQETLCWGLVLKKELVMLKFVVSAQLEQFLAIVVHLADNELSKTRGPQVVISTHSGIDC